MEKLSEVVYDLLQVVMEVRGSEDEQMRAISEQLEAAPAPTCIALMGIAVDEDIQVPSRIVDDLRLFCVDSGFLDVEYAEFAEHQKNLAA